MEYNEEEGLNSHISEGNENFQSEIDRQSVLNFFKNVADDKAELFYQSKLKRERETIELMGGRKTSLHEEQTRKAKLIESIPQNYGPKYSQFFSELGRLAKWTDEEIKRFAKPQIAPKFINKYIYARFPPDVVNHILENNPYIKWWVRQHKHYLFLGEDGILMLEKFIDDAVTVMRESSTVYEFEKEYSRRFGIGFQSTLFEEYLGLII